MFKAFYHVYASAYNISISLSLLVHNFIEIHFQLWAIL